MLTDQHPGAQVASDQSQQPFVGDGPAQQVHQHVVIDRIEELGQVDVHRDAVAVLHSRLHLPDRLVCVAARSKAKARFRKRRIENRREHLGDGLLDHAVGDRGNSKQTFATVGLGYLDPSHRLRPVSPLFDLPSQCRPMCARMGRPVLHRHAVNARRSLVGLDPLPRSRQVVAGQHRFEQLLFRFVLFQGSVRADRRCTPPVGGNGVRSRSACVCSLCLVVQPFSGPNPGHLLRRLLTSAPSRRALPRVALCAWMGVLPFHRLQRAARRSAWFLMSRLNRPGMPPSTRTARGADLPR